MVISRDIKKILLVKKAKSIPIVKEPNWNLLIAILSTIMALIGIPSMISACFEESMGVCGTTIFLFCVGAIAFFLGILYIIWLSWKFQVSITEWSETLSCVVMALGISFYPVAFFYLFTNNLCYFFICLIIGSFLIILGRCCFYHHKIRDMDEIK